MDRAAAYVRDPENTVRLGYFGAVVALVAYTACVLYIDRSDKQSTQSNALRVLMYELEAIPKLPRGHVGMDQHRRPDSVDSNISRRRRFKARPHRPYNN